MNKKIFFGLVIALAALSGLVLMYPNASTRIAVAKLISQKYDRPAGTVTIAVASDTGVFAKGTVNFTDAPGSGGIWFAAKTASGWELAFDGNGIVPCDAADKYNFPNEMIPQCIDTRNGNILIQRTGSPDGGIVCTMEAKLCPDGSYVGRSGPKCEFAACPGAAATSTLKGSGVRGTITLGPTCPVERIPPDPNCADRPYETLVAIFPANDPVHATVITRSNASGMFTASLTPGDYVIGAGESKLPRCGQIRVTVRQNEYSAADISCDTGIR